MKPADAQAGTAVTATATGSSPCGAVHIDWGDGTAITYATSTLPVTQSHVYQAGGTFNVRAQGMGNCDGQATARVTITAPPPAPARLTGVEVAPAVQMPRTPVTITMQGNGSCRVAVDFGDGNAQDVSGALPLSIRHTYPLAGDYTIAATPAAPCGGRQTAALTIAERPAAPRITGVEVSRVRDASAGLRAIRVTGSGQCAYAIDYGDGNSESRSAGLPEVVRHNYPADGQYTIVVTATAPCTGAARSTVAIGGDARGRVSRVEIEPRLARTYQAVTLTVAGTGTCRLKVDLGNGQSREMTGTLPHRFTYRYPEPGDYEVFVWTEAPCDGDAGGVVRVRRRLGLARDR